MGLSLLKGQKCEEPDCPASALIPQSPEECLGQIDLSKHFWDEGMREGRGNKLSGFLMYLANILNQSLQLPLVTHHPVRERKCQETRACTLLHFSVFSLSFPTCIFKTQLSYFISISVPLGWGKSVTKLFTAPKKSWAHLLCTM